MRQKIIKEIPSPFPPHKVVLKSISKLNNEGYYYWSSPCEALDYLCKLFDGQIIVAKQKVKSMTVLIYCGDLLYEPIKLRFIRSMGDKFIWND